MGGGGMRIFRFEDTNNKIIQVSMAGNGYYRIYTDPDAEGQIKCITLNKYQAKILINSLWDLIKGKE